MVFECKTATFKTELQVCTGPSPHLWFCAFKTVNEAPQLTSLWVPDLACGFVNAKLRANYQNYKSERPSPHLMFCAFKVTNLATDLHVCMGPRPHEWICAHITECLAQEYQVYIDSSPHLWFCA